ncbi:leucine zipper domain-containing protein [Amycolatopsis sp. NBC_00355]
MGRPELIESRRRFVVRCQSRPIAHVAAEMDISRQCASKWINRRRRHGAAGLSTTRSPRTTSPPRPRRLGDPDRAVAVLPAR